MTLYVMLYAVVAGTPILAAAALEAAFLRTHGRAERGVWVIALILVLPLPLAVLVRPELTSPPGEVAVVSDVVNEIRPVLVIPAAPDRGSSLDFSTLVLALWLTASGGIAARWSVSWVKLLRGRRSWSSRRMDGVPVTVTADVGPGVFGLLQPRIVIPSWVATLPPERRAFVLRHEQEHVRGHDHWLGALARVARTLLPWNPIVWLLTSRLHRAMELDCDRRVLRDSPDVAGYGETLLLVSERRSHGLMPSAAFVASDATLRKRIIAMTAPTRTLSAAGVVAAITLGAVLLTGALRVPVPALGTPVPRLERVMAVPPPRLTTPIETLSPVASSAVASSPAPAVQQAAPPALPEVRILRGRVSMYLYSPAERPSLTALGYGIVTAGGRVLVDPRSNSAALPYLRDDRLTYITFDDPVPVVVSAPFPGGPPKEITESPRILNPAEVTAAIADAYPPSLRDRGIGGTVGVHFLVGEAGEVLRTRVGQISAYPALDEAALRVAAVYRFSPARAGDEYLALWVSHAIDFRVP